MPDNPLSTDLNHILDHTRDLWDELRGERIFITGGTGFFGCWLLESFLWANQKLDLGARAVVLTRRPDSVKRSLPHLMLDPSIHLHEGDVRNFEFPKGECSHIIHAATESNAKLSDENPVLILDTIIEGTRHTLDFAVHCKARKFLLTSSGAVYGKQPSDLTHIPEDYPGAPDPLDPRSAYGIGKRTAEQLCALYQKHYGVSSTIARCFAFVGPYLPLDIHFAIGNFLRDVMNGGSIVIKGDGTPYRSYLYAADLAIWLCTILLRGTPGRAYNVGSEESISIAEVAKRVVRSVSSNVKIEIQGRKQKNQTLERYVPSTQKAITELNLRQTIDLDQAIQHTVQFLKSKTQEF